MRRVLALTLVVGLLASCSADEDGSRDGPMAGDEPVWASGTTLHYGDAATVSPVAVRVFVKTDYAYVVADEDGGVWSVAPGGSSEQIGTTTVDSWPHLVVDQAGSLVGWAEPVPGGIDYVVYDTGAAAVLGRIPRGEFPDATPDDPEYYPGEGFVALDSGKAYLRTPDGFAAFHAGSGERLTTVDGTLLDVVDSALVLAQGRGMLVRWPNGDEITVPITGQLSPDALFLYANVKDTDVLLDVTTGQRQELVDDSPEGTSAIERAWPSPLGWTSAGRLLAVDVNDNRSPADLMTCGLDGVCSVLVRDAAQDGPLLGATGTY